MRKTLIFAMFLVLPFLAGCQGFMQPTPVPTLTVVSLASSTQTEPTWTPRAARATAVQSRLARPRRRSCSRRFSPPTAAAGQRIMALGVRPALVLRASPQAGAAVVATLPGSQVTWAEGRSPDGRWLRVAYGDVGARRVACPGRCQPAGRSRRSASGRAGSGWTALDPTSASAAEASVKSAPGGLAGRVLADQVDVRRGPGLDQAAIGQPAQGNRSP